MIPNLTEFIPNSEMIREDSDTFGYSVVEGLWISRKVRLISIENMEEN